MEYYNNTLCVEGGWLYNESQVMSIHDYRNLSNRNQLQIVRRGCKGTPALVAYDSLPDRFKRIIVDRYGDPHAKLKPNMLIEFIEPDPKAKEYFDNYLTTNGNYLTEKQRNTYYTNAIILSAVGRLADYRIKFRKNRGGSYRNVWPNLADNVSKLDKEKYPHSLPSHHRRLKLAADNFKKEGYDSVIHKGLGNKNSKKVNDSIERLLLSIYVMENRPFASWVQDYYLQFLSGNIDVVDCQTGEVFDRHNFFTEDNTPITISESTAWNYLKRPDNQTLVNKIRKTGIDYKTKETAFNHRHRPNFSLSKISFDDRTLPRKDKNGKWMQAYYAYDPMSECFVGTAYSKDKNINLVYECFRNMYFTLEQYNLPWPAEAEVERHLMIGIKDELRSLFAYVRFCIAQNSREKRAEHGIKLKKYGTEKRIQNNIGRWSNKHDAYQINEDYVQKLSPEQLIEDDKQSIRQHNHSLHGNQKQFPGKTRWQVLMENVNPKLKSPNKRIIYKYIGFKTITSVRNNDFVRVQYSDYALSTMNILSNLKPNNYEVEAYWIPSSDGNIPEVYLYQGKKFLCHALKYEKYNEAIAERDDKDKEIRLLQKERITTQRNIVKEGIKAKITKVKVIEPKHKLENTDIDSVEVAPDPVKKANWDFEQDDDFYDKKALDY